MPAALRIQVLQHEPFEGPGLVAEWAQQKGHPLLVTELYAGQALPNYDDFDWLVIMGGGMSVNDEDTLPWLKPEKQLIKHAINSGKTVIGFCLGSQLIANVLGCRVYKNTDKEIGWWPIELTAAGKEVLGEAWHGQVFFHWHGETFDMPAGARHLAYSTGCRHQAFSIGSKVFGFQFHPETNGQTLQQMVTAGHAELLPAPYVMGAETIMQQAHYLQQTRPLLWAALHSIEEAKA